MKLGSIRSESGLRGVLKDPQTGSAADVYWVFTDISDHQKWFNVTLIASGQFGQEFTKTHGHYHQDGAPDETYKLIEGEGVLLMQKKHLENGQLIPNQVDEVFLIKAQPGDEVVITQDWGHSWSNVGKLPLISFDDWRSGHTPGDYEAIEKLHGMAYYLVSDTDLGVKAVPNPNYQNLPEPKWLSAKEFAQTQK